jgi:hypothetical protein
MNHFFQIYIQNLQRTIKKGTFNRLENRFYYQYEDNTRTITLLDEYDNRWNIQAHRVGESLRELIFSLLKYRLYHITGDND